MTPLRNRALSPAHQALWKEREAKRIGTGPLARRHAERVEAVIRAALMVGVKITAGEVKIIEMPGTTELRIQIPYPKEDPAP